MFLRWKGRVYKQLFYIMTANASPLYYPEMVATH